MRYIRKCFNFNFLHFLFASLKFSLYSSCAITTIIQSTSSSLQVCPVRNYVSDSWQNHVDHESGGDRPDVGSVHGDGRAGPDDPRDHHATADLLVHHSKESGGVLQGHDAGLGDGPGYGFEVIPVSSSSPNKTHAYTQCKCFIDL